MREMKKRLLAIETELQALYRETGEESEVRFGWLRDSSAFLDGFWYYQM